VEAFLKAMLLLCVFFLFPSAMHAANGSGRMAGFSEGGWIYLMSSAGFASMGFLIIALLRSVRRFRRAEAKLLESEEEMNLSTEVAQLGRWVWDLQHDKVWISEKLAHHYAASGPTEITTRAFLAAIHPEDRHAAKTAINEAIENKTRYDARYRILKKDGTICWMYSAGRVTEATLDKNAVLVGVALDITEQMEAR